jgi:hypothetical protein
MVMGYNPFTPIILDTLNLTPQAIPRFRDAYIDDDGNLVLLTRTGGGNREDYVLENAELAARPDYLGDVDDSFDETFAHFTFRTPASSIPAIATALKAQGHYDPLGRFRAMTEQIGQGGGSPRAKRATEAIAKQLGEAINNPPKDGVIRIGDIVPTHDGSENKS